MNAYAIRFFVSAVVTISATAAHAQNTAEIALTPSNYNVRIEASVDARTVQVSLDQFTESLLSISIGNALFDPTAVQNVRLCEGCAPVYFIPVFDASSTYGARTSVIAYSSGENYWSLSVLPINLASVEDEDGDGVFELQDNHPRGGDPIKYLFHEGMLSQAP